MPDKAPELTADERDIVARSGMSAEKYARIRDTPSNYGARPVEAILAALEPVPDDRKD